MIKKYSLVLMAFACFVLNGFGQYSGSGSFTKINSIAELTDGYYVITNETDAFLMTNGRSGNETTGYFISDDATPVAGEIIDPAAANVWLIETNGSGRIIYNELIDRYVGWASGNSASIEATVADTNRWTFSYIDGKFTVNNVDAPVRQLSYNAGAPRFAAYGNTNQHELQLYKLTPTCTDAPDDFNVQWPTGPPYTTITHGDSYDVYVRVNEPGVTDASNTDAGVGLQAWVGYNTVNDNPEDNGNWTWIPATYNQDYPPYDEFMADIGSGLAPGTYYYASRFQLNGCAYVYGGIGGVWNNDSVELIVEPDQVDFCNLQSPATGNISIGKPYDVYARAYEPSVTEADGANGDLTAWVGYSTTNTDPATWPVGNWVPATYQGQFGNDDEYRADIGPYLTPAGTYYYASRFQLNGSSYSYGGITPPNGGSHWDGITYISGVVNVTNPPNAPTGFRACMDDTTASLNWNAPASGTTPDGYVVFAIEGGTNISGAKLDAIQYTANSDFATAPTETPTTLGKVVYKGSATVATVTGLTENQNYSFTVFAYKNESSTGWSSATAGSRQTNVLAEDDVRNLTATPDTNQVTLNWSVPTPISCWDQLIIVANQGNVSFNPSGTYTNTAGASVYTAPNQIVYATGSNVNTRAISGLTNDIEYCFKVFIRRGTEWTEGVEICATPTLTYCESYGNTTFGTGITQVQFNTLNNASPVGDQPAYSDYTSISTSLNIGETYDISVNVNTDGNFTTTTRVWIDWNRDGIFTQGTEGYELGTAYNTTDGTTSESPLSIEVPTTAVLGPTGMRVSTIYNTTPTTPCQTSFDGEVEDYTINVQRPPGAEINIKGLAISIPNGFNAPYGLNNTLFGSTNIGASAGPKTYTIENLGLAPLNLTGTPRVMLTGDHPGDFIVTQQPSAATIASAGSLTFQLNFTPTADGERTAIVSILNSDNTDGENPYTFKIKGTGQCTTTITSTILPTSGPVGTEVTITSPSNMTGATATLNGEPMTIVSSTASELVVSIPAGATPGPLHLVLNTGCSSANTFTLIENAIGGCEASSASTIPTDLFITEVTDATNGSSSYVEIFNGTGAPINLGNYNIRVYNNGNDSPSSTNALSGTLNSGDTHVVSLGTTDCTLNNLPSGIPDQSFSSASGINFNNNSSDMIALYKISVSAIIDAWGVYESNTWANGLGIGTDGANFRRKNTASPLPSTVFDLDDWDLIDWTSCGDSDYVGLGAYDFSVGIPPTVGILVPPVLNCELSTSISVTAAEGYNDPGDAQELTYQWYYSAPGELGWTAVPDNAIYDDVNTDTLQILNVVGLDGYQYYCQVRENDATCFVASNAIKLTVPAAVWDGTAWTPGAPDIDTIAIIDGDYNTGTDGSFSACSLWVQSGTLTIDDNSYVEVQNNVTVDSEITVEEHGSFVQRNDIGTVTVTGTVLVSKRTAPMNNWYEYTYWGSPVENETIGDALSEAHPNRRFRFEAQNYLDATAEANNDGAEAPGQDDVDDDGNDWVPVNGSHVMLPGVGYASTHSPSLYEAAPGPGPKQFLYTFEGPFNNGVYNVPIYRNDTEENDKNYNLLGNPYPSAISADDFLIQNTVLNNATDGAIYLWSQNTLPSGTANGNEVLNFSDDDYAIINSTAETAGGDGTMPSRYVPSGQGFFVTMSNTAPATPIGGNVHEASVTFNNAMRVTGDNDRFFRTSINALPNKLWVNLTSDNGVFNQIAIGYVDGATTAYDGMYYDAPRTLSATTRSILYSIIPDSDLKFAIQGKDPSSLTLDEVIPLGFYTAIDVPTLYTFSIAQMEGNFLAENPVYVRDYLLNVTHNLSASDYTFTSETGAFNDRFEIVFRETALSVGDHEIPASGLSIIELQNGTVKFTVGHGLNIQAVEIMDMLGRRLYKLKGNSPVEIFDLSNLSQAAYIAKVTLSNGQVLTKRAIKRR